MAQRDTNGTMQMLASERPYQGWAWRGDDLNREQLRFFLPGRVVKHLGIARLTLEPPQGCPVVFMVRLHLGWVRRGSVTLPSDTCFEVSAVEHSSEFRSIVVLEQVIEGEAMSVNIHEEIRKQWPRLEAPLRSLDAKNPQGGFEPFACWLPTSKAGDPPILGPLYDFEEAVQFAAAWSGLEESLTHRLLAAKERYLELSGIAEVQPDARLEGEREQFRHCLPINPGCLEEGLNVYLACVTGCNPSEIEAADRGEMAYLDYLGLVVWDDEDERELRLGLPPWRPVS